MIVWLRACRYSRLLDPDTSSEISGSGCFLGSPDIDVFGVSDHNIHVEELWLALKVDLLLELEAHLAVDYDVDVVRALEIAHSTCLVGLRLISMFSRERVTSPLYLVDDIVHELLSIPLSTGFCTSTDVVQVPGIWVQFAENLELGAVE
jgi:hypothetical protein